MPVNMYAYLLLLVTTLVPLMVDSASQTRTEVITKLLEDYDHRIPPNFERNLDGPTKVQVQIYVYSVDSFNEATMDYSLCIFLQQKWIDQRLQWQGFDYHEPLELDAKFMDELWVPDTFFSNEKSADFHYVTVQNRMMHLHKDGKILYSVRLSLTLSCQMKLHKYPFDSQICSISLESYGHTTASMVFEWFEQDALEIKKGLELPQFDLLDTTLHDCTKTYGGTNYTCLEAKLHLKRKVGYFIIQIYVPSILIVILSWVSFWLNVDAIPARISLGVLTILTMTTQSSGARSSLPRVSYIKAIDVWMSACLLFVFAGLVEFAVVNVMARKQGRTSRHSVDEEAMELVNRPTHTLNGNPKNKRSAGRRFSKAKKDQSGLRKANNVDKMSRLMFPLAFIVFNAVYWLIYMVEFTR
ncbi:glycine receptor subunit alpha-2-like isoform X2 [Liolophura sinensis]|uniref:glycine receptor subunit alpha-2-like isoform X2 n=1 Tax=Liolophura sinensis TaxID=3198878 RepID=UPI003159062A